MSQSEEQASHKVDRPETLLLAIAKDGTIRIGVPPRHLVDNYPVRAAVLGKLENVSHVVCSPEGELFCVRDGDLYRGPLPSNKDVDWFSIARRVGKWEWSKFKILFFHPNGDLYGTTNEGEFYKGPQPSNENLPWMHGQATNIGAKGWEKCEALFFDPSGILYALNKQDNIMKANPPTTQDYEEWVKSVTVAGQGSWLKISHFMSFSPDGKLWTVNKENGNIYRGSIPDDGRYIDNAETMGHEYNLFHFLAFTTDKTIRDVISFEFLTERGQRVSQSQEVIEEKIYDNRRSTCTANHNFIFEKTLIISSSFSHDHGFTFEDDAKTTFTTGIPVIYKTATMVGINKSTNYTWSFIDTNETEVTFSSSSSVEVHAGKAIRVVASVMRSDLLVPYRAKVRTLYGFETEIEGTWSGAAYYNLMVTQDDYETCHK